MGSWGHLLCVSLLLCVCAPVLGHSLHAVGPCLVNTGKAAFHCAQRKLTEIPEEIWTNVTKLDLADNNLILRHQTLKSLQKFDKLVYLNLSANYLPLLARNMFSTLTSLEVLDLSSCKLSVIETGALEALPRLRKLYLAHNEIQKLPCPVLETSRGVLSLLDLQGNPCHSSAPYDGPKGSRRVFRLKATQGPMHEHNYEGLEEGRMSGKHRKLLSEAPHTFTTSSTPNLTPNSTDTASTRVPAHNWKFLVGVLIVAITLSITVAVVAKCKLFHRYLSSYRHSRFTNIDSERHYDPDVYEVGFAQRGGAATIPNEMDDHDEEEREGEEEDDDGFIEDNYIQPNERERAERAAEHRQKKEAEGDQEDDTEDEMFTIG